MTARDTAAQVATMAGAIAPMLPPQIALALGIAARLTNLVLDASAAGVDVDEGMIQRAIGEYAAARTENAATAAALGKPAG